MTTEVQSWRHAPKSEETKRRISASLKGVPMKDYLVEQQSFTYRKILPLLNRNANAFEIQDVTDLSEHQIHGSIHTNKRGTHPHPYYFNEENRLDRKSRELMWRGKKSHGNFPNMDQANNIAFAKKLFESGFVREDTAFWKLTQEISRSSERNWFDEFSLGIIMETYVKAKVEEMSGNRNLMQRYLDLGRSVNEQWFHELGQERDLARESLQAIAKQVFGSISKKS